MKRNLTPAIRELEEIGFLEPLEAAERFRKIGKEWRIRLVKKANVQEAKPTPSQGHELSELKIPFESELTKRGVSAKVAAALVQTFPPAFIEAKLEEFDWEMTKPKPPKKPAGYLVKSIRDGYATDPNFISTAERQRRDELKRQAAEAGAETRRRKVVEEAKACELDEKVAAFRKSCSAEKLDQLEADALAGASEEERASLDGPSCGNSAERG